MKKIGFGLILSILLFCSPMCQAQERGVLLLTSEQEKVEMGEEFEIAVELSNQETTAFQFTLNWDSDKLELLSQVENANVVNHRILYLWYDNNGGTRPKTGELARFRFRAKEEGIARFLVEGDFFHQTGEEQKLVSEERKIQIGEEVGTLAIETEEEDTQREENTNLETLAIQDVLLYPPFQASETNYTAEVANTIGDLTLLAVPEQENATIEISGTQGLQEGENMVIIRVIAPTGETKEYVVKVYKRNAEEEEKYEEEQAKMPEKLKQAYEIEKLSTSPVSEMPEKEEKTEEKSTKQLGTILILIIGSMLGIIWYVLEQKKNIKK